MKVNVSRLYARIQTRMSFAHFAKRMVSCVSLIVKEFLPLESSSKLFWMKVYVKPSTLTWGQVGTIHGGVTKMVTPMKFISRESLIQPIG